MTPPIRKLLSPTFAPFLILLILLGVAGCPDKPDAPAVDAAPAAIFTATPAAPAVDAAPGPVVDAASAPPADAGRDAPEPRRYDPKYKCPTGQTHFYLEGDFCRKKCFSASDCARGERCSAMEYPFLLDGRPAGSGHFCEGT
jgi:hypothetical protein